MIDVTVDDDNSYNPKASRRNEVSQPESTENEAQNDLNESPEKESIVKPILYFSIALLLYIFLGISSINEKYVDFGDGNYLYLSWRLVEGDVLYKDLPSPQPPMLLFLGALLMSLTEGDPILIRLWQVLQHCLIACCVWGISYHIFKRPFLAALAGSIYLFLPEGVWWAAGYQSEPLLILFLSINTLFLLNAVQKEKPSLYLYGSAFFAALACFTNMTSLPYVVLQWFFVGYSYRNHFMRYSITLITINGIFLAIMMVYSNGEYIDHIFFRQVGTYPSEFTQLILYSIFKLYQESADILQFEGGFVIASIYGLLLFTEQEEIQKVSIKPYIIWWAIFGLGSIIFVTKGGTVEYIFTLGEPAVAIFSAFFLTTILTATDIPTRFKDFLNAINLGKITIVLCFLIPILFLFPLSLLYRTFSDSTIKFGNMGGLMPVFEIKGEEMTVLNLFIQKNCPEDKTMIAPPYYAFLAKRKLAENSSSLFILYMAYINEWEVFEKKYSFPYSLYPATKYNTQGIYNLAIKFKDQPELGEEFPAIQLFLNLREQILHKEVGLIVANVKHTFFDVPPLHQAIRDYCKVLDKEKDFIPDFYTREEKLEFYVPK
jgi:hypothetical protein